MPDHVFPPHAQPAAPIEGTQALFPVRRIYCVGRNYDAHRREMGGDDRDPPFFFAKPADALVTHGRPVAYPSATAELHYEVELVVALGAGGVMVPAEQALSLVFGYAVGVDMTRRDLQAVAREKGAPWEASKAFDASAPIGLIRPAALCGDARGPIRLDVNGKTRQNARISDMIWNVPEIIAEASKLWRLEAGDLIYTGTPEGIGPLVRGDIVHGEIEQVGVIDFEVV